MPNTQPRYRLVHIISQFFIIDSLLDVAIPGQGYAGTPTGRVAAEKKCKMLNDAVSKPS